MLDEIRQQPDALERTLARESPKARRLRRRFESKRPRLIVLAARGTSDNAAQFGRYLLEIVTGIPVSLAAPSIFTLYGATIDFSDALVVTISQSGESTDTNVVLERARAAGAFTIGITNESKSTMAGIADEMFFVRAGRERSVAATKTYTGQLLSLYLLAYALGARIELDELQRLPDWVAEALKIEGRVREMAGRYRFMNHAVVVGRGLNYANTFEFSLKLMETCYVIAERFSSADFLHGPIAMIETAFPAFAFAPTGVTWQSMSEMLDHLRKAGAETLVLTDAANQAAARQADQSMVIPIKLSHRKRGMPVDLYTPIPYVIPAQLFAACLAEEKGLNPDRPRSLTKVTRTL